jgi:uncharacterized protein YdeI (YjbR/CyaY-like superfamily)
MSAQLPANATHPLTRAQWRQWLKRHHASSDGVFLVTFKKATGEPRVEYDEAVEEALCFGWVDSKPAKLDERRTMLWFSPRKPGSAWAATNKARVARLIAGDLMQPAGLARIEAAKADGSWSKLDGVEALEVPADLAAALAALPPAAEHFAAFPRSARRGILEWIVQARRPETRAKRITETATLAARNERANQWQPKDKA